MNCHEQWERTVKKNAADQEISDPLYELRTHQLYQEQPHHRLQGFCLQQDDEQDDGNQCVDDRCASSRNHNSVKHGQTCPVCHCRIHCSG